MKSLGIVVLILEIVVLLNGVEAYYNVSETNDRLRKVFCAKQYSLNCLKIDLISTAERVGGGGGAEYQLFPGVFLSHQFNASAVVPPETLLESARFANDYDNSNSTKDQSDSYSGNVTRELDTYVTDKVTKYLSSVTLSVKLLDPNAMVQARKLSEQFVSSLFPLEKGRKKGAGMWAGGLWAAGSVAAVGMAALAALAGKAMMTSMLAMMLAAAAALRNNGGGKGHDCGSSHAALIEAMHARHYDTERMSDPGLYRRSEVYSPRLN